MIVVIKDRGDVGGRCTWSMSTVAVRSNSERASESVGGWCARSVDGGQPWWMVAGGRGCISLLSGGGGGGGYEI